MALPIQGTTTTWGTALNNWLSVDHDADGYNITTASDWVNYSSTSTLVGWSGTPTVAVWYKTVGKIVYVMFNITGTSNATATTFTVNDTILTMPIYSLCRSTDNTSTNTAGLIYGAAAGKVISVYPTTAAGNWTASGTKTVSGQFFYMIA